MTEKNNSSYDPSSYSRQEPAGFLERAGVFYYRRLAKKARASNHDNVSIQELPLDDTLRYLAEHTTTNAATIAFAIGAVTTMVTVWVEMTYSNTLDPLAYYSLLGSVTLAMLLIEFAVLFWVALRTVHCLAYLTGHHKVDDDPLLPGNDGVPNILARAALEVPDPVVHYLGVDPLKYVSKSELFLVGLFYKAKVILTSVAAKFLLRRLAGKAGLRMGFAWVAVPITGIWDAVIIYRVAREARLRLFGHRLAQHLSDQILTPAYLRQLSPKAREGAIRAVATMMVLTENYHPNMLMLLVQISDSVNAQDDCDYDDWNAFLDVLAEVSEKERYFLLDLLCIAAAFDGRVSKRERHRLPEAFGTLIDTYMQRIERLEHLLLTGQLHAAKALCTLDFQPG